MSLVIFFGMALCIFTVGLLVIGVTVYQWFKLRKENKELPSWIKSELSSSKNLKESSATSSPNN